MTANAYVTYHAVRGWFRSQAPSPIDPLCAVLLRAILQAGGREGVRDLRTLFGVPPSTMSTALMRLERDGLIERYPDSLDRRMRAIELTSGGRLAARLVTPVIDGIETTAEQTVGRLGLKGYNLMANVIGMINEEPDPWT